MELFYIKKIKIKGIDHYKGYLNFLFFWRIPLTRIYEYKTEVEQKLNIY